jgi:hypothetical protein
LKDAPVTVPEYPPLGVATVGVADGVALCVADGVEEVVGFLVPMAFVAAGVGATFVAD